MDSLNDIITPEREQAELMLRLIRVMDDPTRKDGTWSANEQHLAMRMLRLFASNGLELRASSDSALMFRSATLILKDMAGASGSPELAALIDTITSELNVVVTNDVLNGHTFTDDCPACKEAENDQR